MTKGLDDSDRTYTDSKGGHKRQNKKNAQLCFAQKTLRLTKTMRITAVSFVIRLTKNMRMGSVRIGEVGATDERNRQLLTARS